VETTLASFLPIELPLADSKLTKLDRIAQIAKERPKEKFTSLMHLIDEDMLKYCNNELDRKKATGIDKVTKDEYETTLDNNIKELTTKTVPSFDKGLAPYTD
jgi:hypothetical protein